MALYVDRLSIAAWLETAVSWAFAIVVAGMAFAAIYVATVSGPPGRATAEQQRARQIADEDAAFCDRYAGARDTSRHAACMRDLLELRAMQEKRHDAEMEGVL
jgi:hypothetical protein